MGICCSNLPNGKCVDEEISDASFTPHHQVCSTVQPTTSENPLERLQTSQEPNIMPVPAAQLSIASNLSMSNSPIPMFPSLAFLPSEDNGQVLAATFSTPSRAKLQDVDDSTSGSDPIVQVLFGGNEENRNGRQVVRQRQMPGSTALDVEVNFDLSRCRVHSNSV